MITISNHHEAASQGPWTGSFSVSFLGLGFLYNVEFSPPDPGPAVNPQACWEDQTQGSTAGHHSHSSSGWLQICYHLPSVSVGWNRCQCWFTGEWAYGFQFACGVICFDLSFWQLKMVCLENKHCYWKRCYIACSQTVSKMQCFTQFPETVTGGCGKTSIL